MSDIKLFRTDSASVTELRGSAVALEKLLQTLIERNMEAFLGVRFLASEFPTSNGGRMDSLGIDENGSPVIIEYKRASNENVINQGLFYLDWLMDHRRDFEWLVLERFGAEQAKAVDWGTLAPDLHCRRLHQVRRPCGQPDEPEHCACSLSPIWRRAIAVRTANLGIGTIRARNPCQHRHSRRACGSTTTISPEGGYAISRGRSQDLVDLYEATKAVPASVGRRCRIEALDNYVAFRRLKNFACVEVKPQIRHLKVFVKVDPDTTELEPGFTRDVRNIGHFGIGDLEIIITDVANAGYSQASDGPQL